MKTIITTSGTWRDLLLRSQVPKSVLSNHFDWCKSETNFFRYHGTWYHLSQFIRTEPGSDVYVAGFGGIHSDSATTGVVVKVSADGERVQVGSCRVVADVS